MFAKKIYKKGDDGDHWRDVTNSDTPQWPLLILLRDAVDVGGWAGTGSDRWSAPNTSALHPLMVVHSKDTAGARDAVPRLSPDGRLREPSRPNTFDIPNNSIRICSRPLPLIFPNLLQNDCVVVLQRLAAYCGIIVEFAGSRPICCNLVGWNQTVTLPWF